MKRIIRLSARLFRLAGPNQGMINRFPSAHCPRPPATLKQTVINNTIVFFRAIYHPNVYFCLHMALFYQIA